MRYAWARYRESRQESAYRIYVSDCLRILTENTAKQISLTPQPKDTDVRGAYLTARFIEPKREEKSDPLQEGDKIVENVLKLLGVT